MVCGLLTPIWFSARRSFRPTKLEKRSKDNLRRGHAFRQYSSGNSRVVADRSPSLIIHSFSPAAVVYCSATEIHVSGCTRSLRCRLGRARPSLLLHGVPGRTLGTASLSPML